MVGIHNLFDLLNYHIASLYSAEEQVEQSMQLFIEKANHQSVRNALSHHAGLTPVQKQRLKQIQALITEKRKDLSETVQQNPDQQINPGIKGLLEEVNQLLAAEVANEVKDAAIIAAIQKIEHYEICSYGTALAFAKQLQLHRVIQMLDETLQEEYDADNLLTALATAAINKEGVPEGAVDPGQSIKDSTRSSDEDDSDIEHKKVEGSERTIHSPGGRAGTSHRGYGTGESRGH